MKKHILICGEKGVGKSTLIRRLLEAADYVTHMVKEKHPYDRGIAARRGVEY